MLLHRVTLIVLFYSLISHGYSFIHGIESEKDLNYLYKELEGNETIRIAPWIKLNETVEFMEKFDEEVSWQIKNIDNINCVEKCNGVYKNMIFMLKNTCNTIFDVLNGMEVIAISEQSEERIKKLFSQLKTHASELQTTNTVTIYDERYYRMAKTVAYSLKQIKKKYKHKIKQFKTVKKSLFEQVSWTHMNEYWIDEAWFKYVKGNSSVYYEEAIFLAHELRTDLEPEIMDIQNNYESTIDYIDHTVNVINSAFKEKAARNIDQILYDFEVVHVYGKPSNCIELTTLNSLKSKLKASCSKLGD